MLQSAGGLPYVRWSVMTTLVAPVRSAPVRPRSRELDDLLARTAVGDVQAFAAVYDATSARVLGLALRVVRDRAQAEEVVQEVYLDIWRNAARFDASRGRALGWVMMKTHGAAVDRVRSAHAQTAREEDFARSDVRDRPVALDPTFDLADAAFDAERVRNALGRLTPLQREAVEVAYLQGLTYAEVAGVIGVPLGTVKSRIRAGLSTLGDLMGTP